MAARHERERRFGAIVFDLDETLIDSRVAWRYTLEEAVAAVCGRRIDAGPLVGEYRKRPWRHSVAVVLDGAAERTRCEALCERMYGRSSMKRLLVFDGVAMALDEIRGARLEVGAISRLPHALALKQAESTGIDRFLTVLAPTPEGEPWSPADRAGDCLRYLDRSPAECLFVGAEADDLDAIGALGGTTVAAGWTAAGDGSGHHLVAEPSQLARLALAVLPPQTESV